MCVLDDGCADLVDAGREVDDGTLGEGVATCGSSVSKSRASRSGGRVLTLAATAVPILDGRIDGFGVVLLASASGAVGLDVAEKLVVTTDYGLLLEDSQSQSISRESSSGFRTYLAEAGQLRKPPAVVGQPEQLGLQLHDRCVSFKIDEGVVDHGNRDIWRFDERVGHEALEAARLGPHGAALGSYIEQSENRKALEG